MDRLVLLYLCDRASRGFEVRFNVREIAKWFGLPWNNREVCKRLHRVVSCRIELPTQHTWRQLRIVEHYTIDWNTGDVHITFGREFRYAAESGAVYSIAVARRLARKIAALDLYLMLVTILYRGKFCEGWHPYDELRSAMRNSKIAQLLRQRMELINEAWPENPFNWVPRTTAIACSLRAFKGHVYRRDEAEEERRMDHEIDSRNRAEFRAYLATLPPWTRDRLMSRYIERCVFPLDDRAPGGTANVAMMDAQSNRGTSPPIGRVHGDESCKRASETEPTEKSATTEATVAAPEACATPAPSTTPSATATTGKQPSMIRDAPEPASTTCADNPARVKPKHPPGLFSRARARIERAGTRAKRLVAHLSSMRRTQATRASPYE